MRTPLRTDIWLNLPYEGLERIEDIRERENERLQLHLDLIVIWKGGRNDAIHRERISGSTMIRDRDWEATLDDLDWHGQRVIALSIPDSTIGDVLDNALGQLTLAEEHHNARRYDDALIAVRKAMEKLQNLEDDDELMGRLDPERKKRVTKAIDEFDASIARLVNVADLGGHTEELITEFNGPIRRRDSELAIDIGKSYLRFLGRVLEED